MKHKILCVDDEADNVDALERLFRKKYQVLKATSGIDALKLMANHTISLIVTDQRMPNMTGVEFLQASQKLQPECMRILLTGFTDIDSVIAAINSGQIYRYVTKPWDPIDLANTVDKAIEKFELLAELKRKNIELEKALTELRTLDEAKSNFMVLINHELKTPLTVMLSFLSLLQETKLDEDQLKYLFRIGQSADRLQALIGDSLELVSAESGTLNLQFGQINIKSLAEELQSSFADAIAKKGMKIDLSLAAQNVRADQKALRSVMGRLFDNAIKFAPENSAIELKTESTSNDQVRISISNPGKGLQPETIAKILKPFTLDENIMHHTKGTGLGLSVAQAVLKRMGSALEVESPSGRFEARFQLPSK